MIYVLEAIVFTVILILYIKMGLHYNITDAPDKRRSHSNLVVRGGGIIFPLIVLWFYFLGGDLSPFFLIGVMIISGVSFFDDLYSLSSIIRIIVQFLCVYFLLLAVGFGQFHWLWNCLLIILILGWLNAFNFMDGINGITAFYALVSTISFYIVNFSVSFIASELLLMVLVGIIVFSFFNARYQAKLFAGDVGSISLAYILAFLMISLIIRTGRWEYILFFSVYGIDSTLTIFFRLVKRKNIFKPHRSHLYQILANENQFSQIVVSLYYAIVQLSINILVLLSIDKQWLSSKLLAFYILGFLCVFYLYIKIKFIKKLDNKFFSS